MIYYELVDNIMNAIDFIKKKLNGFTSYLLDYVLGELEYIARNERRMIFKKTVTKMMTVCLRMTKVAIFAIWD